MIPREIRPLIVPRVVVAGALLVALWALVPIAAFAALWTATDVAHRGHVGCTERVSMRAVVAALHDYHRDFANMRCPRSLQSYVDTGYFVELPVDEWGHPFAYSCDDAHPVRELPGGPSVVSAGPDGAFGSDDDLRSWDPVNRSSLE